MALGPAKLTDLDDPLRGPQAAAAPAAPAKRASRPRRDAQPGGEETAKRSGATGTGTSELPSAVTADEPIGDPYAGSPKIAVNMRATKELWDRLGALTRELEGDGFRTSRTELTEALWHFDAPRTAADARDLVRRYRRARIG
jgi:hypothetical protein